MKNPPSISQTEYAERRSRLMASIGPKAVALIQGGPKEDSHERFRQVNDFRYFCSAEVPHAYLLIDARDSSTHLFWPAQPPEHDREEPLLGSHDPGAAVQATGVEAVHDLAALARFLERVQTLYTPFRQGEGAWMSWDTLQRSQQEGHSDPWDGRPDRMRWFLRLLRERCPAAQILDLAPLIDEMRLVKSEGEIALLRRAGRLSALGVTEAMRSTRPGVMEYQLDAVMRYGYLAHGARDVAYRAIIAGDENAWYGHYNANDQALHDGDLVLVDCAPDYHYYTSDIGRMWPVNGHYSPVQRELYGFIVEYHKVFLSLLEPGTDDETIRLRAADEMKKVVDKMTFSKPIYEAAARRALVFPHHLSHPVGLTVHDVGHYRGQTLRPGIVLTVDPQLIIPEERRYIRVEDTVVITETGIENFTQDAPLELDEVEACMREPGLLERYPADWLDGC
ncbi:MAG: aminopeptidase P N-terminal domain-containing protein [Trueperaceae bacterium]|nr:MAG: aminopeptidase P N-terminal domain-containing protein [Trueperaceae bacterium]